MEFVLPLPRIDDHSSESWRSWSHMKQRFKGHIATQHQEQKQPGSWDEVPPSSLLMFISGNKIRDILKALSLDIDVKLSKIDKIFENIEDLCLPNFILLYERFKFFSFRQRQFEDLSKFVLELQILGGYCELQDQEKNYVTDRIVNGVSSESLRQHLRSIKDLQLEEALKICKEVDQSSSDKSMDKGDKEIRYSKDVENKKGIVSESNNVVLTENVTSQKLRSRARNGRSVQGSLNSAITRNRSNRDNQTSCLGNVTTLSPLGRSLRQTFGSHSNCNNQSRKSVKRRKSMKSQSERAVRIFHSPENLINVNHVVKKTKDKELKTKKKVEEKNKKFDNIKENDVDNEVETKTEIVGVDDGISENGNLNKEKRCFTCGQAFATVNLLKCHSRIHSGEKIYKCGVCGMGFIHSGGRSRHVRQAHPEVLKFSCDECDMMFGRKIALERHKLSHSKEQEVICNICGLKLSTTREYYQHQRLQHRDTRYSCELCGLHFPFPSKLKLHLMNKHNATKPFMCEICGSSFAEKNMLATHKNIHTGEKKYECTTCGRRFLLRSILNNHIQTHQECKPYTCDVCGMSFKLAYYLKSHMKVHSQTRVRPHMCSKCGATFLKLAQLRNHERKHTGEKPYKCDICHSAFSQLSSMKKHIKLIHEGLKPKDRFSCEYCGLSFTHSSKLKLHLMKHTGERPFACKVCGSTYRENHQLRSHMKIHYGNEPFKCPICDRRFLQKTVFEGHVRRHTGEKPFKCSVCPQSFSHKAYLKDHIKVHDENRERKYKCGICDKAFTCSSHMRSHERLHSGEKPHKCNICGSRFTKRSSVKKHLKRTHGIKDLTSLQNLDSLTDQIIKETAVGPFIQLQPSLFPQQTIFSHQQAELHKTTQSKAHPPPPELTQAHSELQVNLPNHLGSVLHSGINTQVLSKLSTSQICPDKTEVQPGIQPHLPQDVGARLQMEQTSLHYQVPQHSSLRILHHSLHVTGQT